MARLASAARPPVRRSGSILILTVWTLFFLAALAVAVGSYVSGGLALARRAAADTYGRMAMNAGVAHAIAVLDADTNNWDGFIESWGLADIDWQDQRLGDEEVYRIYHVNSLGETNAGLIDEESRINLNKATREQLEATFRIIGEADAIQASTLAAAVIDWRDPDAELSDGGAESGFYSGQQPGYKCPNDDFDTVYELLLLRGMTDDIFNRVYPAVTPYGMGKINLNTADRKVLQVIAEAAGADSVTAEGIASRIVSFRQAGGVFSEASAPEIKEALTGGGMLSAEEEALLERMMVYVALKGSCFRGVAEGGRVVHPGGTSVEFVYSRDKGRILFWKEM